MATWDLRSPQVDQGVQMAAEFSHSTPARAQVSAGGSGTGVPSQLASMFISGILSTSISMRVAGAGSARLD